MRWTWIGCALVAALPARAEEPGADYLELARLAVEAQVKVGDLLREKGDKDGAIAAYEKAVQIFERVSRARAAPAPPPAAVKAAPAKRKVVVRAQPVDARKQGGPEDYVAILGNRKASNQARYNAAVQLGALKAAGAQQALVSALQNDSFDLVRRAAAWSLGQLGKQAVPAIPVLIQQIGTSEEYVGYMSERALGEITKATLGQTVSMGFNPTMSAEERRAVQKKWEAWWAANRAAVTGARK